MELNIYLYSMERKIRTYGGYFESFMDTLTDKEQRKIQYGLDLLKTEIGYLRSLYPL